MSTQRTIAADVRFRGVLLDAEGRVCGFTETPVITVAESELGRTLASLIELAASGQIKAD